MRLILYGVFVFFFVAVPMYLLYALVMPELNALKQTYSHDDQIVQALVTQR